jgi:photosystem II stability/assembly factor-like uncharacterized protein
MIKTILILCVVIAVASADPSWKVLAKTVGVECSGIASPSADIVYVASADNHNGPTVIKSLDGGITYHATKINPVEVMLVLSVAANSNSSALAAGAIGIVYSKDGEEFHYSKVDKMILGASSQDAEDFGASGYGIAGPKNGLCVSLDAGATFKCSPVSAFDAKQGELVRYGAYPSESTWYATSGSWPEQETHQFSKFKTPLKTPKSTERVGNFTEYTGSIAKTSDSGKTWTRVFNDENHLMYFNDIECPTVDFCMAVAEGDVGAFVWRTTDGGATWDNVLQLDPGSSLMAVDMINEKEGFVAGGIKQGFIENGMIYHTVDGGNTWTLSTIHYDYLMFIRCPDAAHCVACSVTQAQTCDILGYN